MSLGDNLATNDFIENSIPYNSFASSSCLFSVYHHKYKFHWQPLTWRCASSSATHGRTARCHSCQKGRGCAPPSQPNKIWKDVIFRERFHIVKRLQRKLEKTLLERVLHRTLLDPLIVCPPNRVKVNLNSILSFWTSVYNHSHQFWSTRRFSHRWFCKVWIEIDLKYSPQTKRFSSSESWSTYRESPSLPLWRVSFRELGVLQSFLTTQLNLNDKKMFH